MLRHRLGPMPKPVTLRATIETGPQAARFRVLSLTRTRADGTAVGSAPEGGPVRVGAGEVLEGGAVGEEGEGDDGLVVAG